MTDVMCYDVPAPTPYQEARWLRIEISRLKGYIAAYTDRIEHLRAILREMEEAPDAPESP